MAAFGTPGVSAVACAVVGAATANSTSAGAVASVVTTRN
eukprot:CAMPEP_0119348676 /NCGR_PEP_ID=MMETSP1333-20130426/109167_1 /TAXON_ID=418940 /ORGANISM="Scyphosphaera apsteinii, Strain RCC1455" /LENGTH=38 /DNA_ID= /DNA_START= /DNA_END= /DNA_ORIENTATION=